MGARMQAPIRRDVACSRPNPPVFGSSQWELRNDVETTCGEPRPSWTRGEPIHRASAARQELVDFARTKNGYAPGPGTAAGKGDAVYVCVF